MPRWLSALLVYLILILLLSIGVRHSALTAKLEVGLGRALGGFALVVAPLWFLGLVDCQRLKALPSWLKIALAGLVALPYYALRVGTSEFHWPTALMLTALPVLTAAFLELPRLPPIMTWRDGFLLGLVAAVYYLNLPSGAWPWGLRFFSKLYLADIVLYGFLVARGLKRTGYSLVPSRSAIAIGAREWAFFAPIAFVLGELLGFIQFRPGWAGLGRLGAEILVTVLLIAIPEEVFFRAVLENLLETRMSGYRALILAAVFFGLSHFNHGARFNWRYVLLATIAGVFYGRAWRARRQILASVVTHTAIDVVWSLWFR